VAEAKEGHKRKKRVKTGKKAGHGGVFSCSEEQHLCTHHGLTTFSTGKKQRLKKTKNDVTRGLGSSKKKR